MKILDVARRFCLLADPPLDVVFTGGGSEADNLAVLGRLAGGGRVVTTPLEHPAVAGALTAARTSSAGILSSSCHCTGDARA